MNITSNTRSDPTTILHRGDHPFIRVPSAVFYRGAYKKRCCEIEELFEKEGKKERVSSVVLDKIRDGFLKSSNTPEGLKEFYRDHCVWGQIRQERRNG